VNNENNEPLLGDDLVGSNIGESSKESSAPLSAEDEAGLRAWLHEPVEAHIARWERGDPWPRPPLSPRPASQTAIPINRMTTPKHDTNPSNVPGTVLNGRYFLVRKLSQESACETWLGRDQDNEYRLVKLWRYCGEQPDETVRALWNSELRLLYRLSSSRAAEESILTLEHASIDHPQQCFVMVMKSEGGGFHRLSDALADRQQHEWLMLGSFKQTDARAHLWKALYRLAKGMETLHRQHIIHRNLSAECIFFDRTAGPETLRLGGFEWSLRLGFSAGSPETIGLMWSTPPEVAEGHEGYSFDADWYSFGIMIARCFFPLEHLAGFQPSVVSREVWAAVDRNEKDALTGLERDLILRLIAENPADRLRYAREIVFILQRIHKNLAAGAIADRDDQPLILVFSPTKDEVVQVAREAGFQPNPEDPAEVYSPQNLLHVANLKEFLRVQLADARIYPSRDRPGREVKEAYLVGKQLTFLIGQFTDNETGQTSWDVAFLRCPTELRMPNADSMRDLRSIPILTLPHRELKNYLDRQRWDRYLETDDSQGRNPELGMFHDFLRCTNQLDLLLSCAQVFRYRVVERTKKGADEVLVIEAGEPRQFPNFCHITGGLPEVVNRELESGKPYCDLFLLTPEPDLHLVGVDFESFWTAERVEYATGHIVLRRRHTPTAVAAPEDGFIRTYGLNGSVRLIDRRKRAIDRLEEHSYLLRALSQPGMVAMDTEAPTSAYQLPSERVDQCKMAIIEDIERVRPIYALQGPPGTGKTTLVAHQLRRILEDDPVAQILVTAQAHTAVDVLRSKVREEAYNNAEQPLSIRLGSRSEKTGEGDEESVQMVGAKLITDTLAKLRSSPQLTDLQRRWLQVLASATATATTEQPTGFTRDFTQLVKRSANITYCTTSAADLAALADGSEEFDWSFDWAIVEEAGKVHGFDLALPLQAGHRWLLLGDHKQLPPFRFDDFKRGIEVLDEVVQHLDSLPDRAFLDVDWIKRWRDKDSEAEKRLFQQYVNRWLKTFEQLFKTLRTVHAEPKVTTKTPIGAKVGMITQQWRMHPDIGGLISKVFYDGQVENATVDETGAPKLSVCHPLRLRDVPDEFQIAGRAIAWIDLPWCQKEKQQGFEEVGPAQDRPRYTNPKEAQAVANFLGRIELRESQQNNLTAAVLSPYYQQVRLLRSRLEAVVPPSGIELLNSTGQGRSSGRCSWAHTVDSFQGNQADMIVVSLVRNNDRLALGFLEEPSRLNVLLSRAERLLVLVGSWDFFLNQVSTVRIENEMDSLWFLKKALAVLQENFDNKHAVFIPASRLLPNNV
jgi:serine/threonine protein kinase